MSVQTVIGKALRVTENDKLFNVTSGLPMPWGIKKEEELQTSSLPMPGGSKKEEKDEKDEGSDADMAMDTTMAYVFLLEACAIFVLTIRKPLGIP